METIYKNITVTSSDKTVEKTLLLRVLWGRELSIEWMVLDVGCMSFSLSLSKVFFLKKKEC